MGYWPSRIYAWPSRIYAKLGVFGPAGYMLGPAGYMVVAHVILVSAQGPNPSFFLFWGTFIRLGGLLGQGLGLGLGPGLDNFVCFNSVLVKGVRAVVHSAQSCLRVHNLHLSTSDSS